MKSSAICENFGLNTVKVIIRKNLGVGQDLDEFHQHILF